jgi:type I restriction enzyme, S subunit
MKPDRLLQHFDQLAEAPDAVPRLRRFILDLAVRGKLVEQDLTDEPAAELLKRIDAEKKRLAKAGEIRREKPLPPVDEDTAPIIFTIPASWEWVPIRRIAPDRGQKIPNKEFSYVDVSAIDKERGIITEPQVLAPDEAPSRARKIVQKGDVIYSCVRPYLLNIAVVDKEFEPEPIVSTAFAVLNGLSLVLPRYLWIVLRSPYFVGCVEVKMRGQAYPAINDGDFAPLPVPLPPLAEQHRIVAKVDELMELCDELEAAQAKRERRRDRLVAATLHGLNNGDASADPGARPTFQDSAHFYFNHLPRLTTCPDHIRQLRQTILNLAVRGKLVEQGLKEEWASRLFGRIQQGQQHLIESGEIRRQQPMPSICTEETPYTVPVSWKWVRLGDLAAEITSGSRGWAEYYSSAGSKFIRAQNIRFGYLDLKAIAHVELPASGEGKRTAARKGDLLIVITGAGVTNPGMLDQDIGEAFVSQHVGLVSPIERATSRWLLTCLMATTACRGELLEKAYGAGKPGLNLDTIRMLRIPLPPLAEQHRIVAKVDELMALCDELEARLTTTATTRRQLLEAALYEAIN